jgi:hypothetical protein
MPDKQAADGLAIYYRVLLNEEKDYLEYTKVENSSVTDVEKWKAALNFRQRCDNAIYRTSKILAGFKPTLQEQYKLRRRGYINEILLFARAGLQAGDLDGANSDIDTFEAQFVDFEGPSVRRRFLNKTLTFAVWLGVVSLIFGLSIDNLAVFLGWVTEKISSYWGLSWETVVPKNPLQVLFFVFVGNSLGVVLAAFTRNLDMNFQNLGNFDAAGLNPSLRFIFVGVVSAVLITFLHQKIISICVGSYCLNQTFYFKAAEAAAESVTVAVDPMKCIVIGIICGLADIAITGILTDTVGKATDKTQTGS